MTEEIILCVDDEPHILNALKRLLRKESYHVLTADSVRRGLEILSERHVQLVISDQRMPEMTGVEFLQRVKDISSDTVRVILSGYADVALIVDSINKGEVFRFLTKPWNDDELRAAIRQCLAQYNIVRQNRTLHEQIQAQNRKLRQLNLKMEEMVQFRTRSLQLAQEILEKLPLPLVGVSREGIIVQTNLAAEELIEPLRQLPPGTDMNEVLPDEIVQAVRRRLDGGDLPASLHLDWLGKSLNLTVRHLGDNDVVRGCILILEKAHDR
jgi:response regulator RpfG family c-di-GMP phosphodiesterase